jgi:formate hydrogenlyase subunit 6/NADH:ubiquinone oxidoreductase subunit I
VPIDKTFRDTWQRIGEHEGHPVWQSRNDESSRIHGNIVGVDFSLCYGCEKCIAACPTHVFVIFTDEKKRAVVDPLNESDCIFCLVCEIVCPVDAISIDQKAGSEDTLKSLLQNPE